jgi:transcriptional accessory protein Tex/SPT6
VNQKVMATVIEVDLERKRISLSLKANPLATRESRREERGERSHPGQNSADRDRSKGSRGGGKGGPAKPRRASAEEIRDRRSFPIEEDWFTLALKKGKKP